MNTLRIENILAESILDSRKKPTLKVTVFALGQFASFMVPSGASTGANEAHELRDEDGFGVDQAVRNVNEIIAKEIIGMNVFDQIMIDKILIDLDGTKNKKKLGANAILGVSVACAKLGAISAGQKTFEYLRNLKQINPSSCEAPFLYMNLVNGGKHAKNGLAFQEYMVVPQTSNIEESIEAGIKIQNSLTEIIKRELGEDSLILGDEGGYAPKIKEIKKPLLFLAEAIEKNNFPFKVKFALDVAGTSFYENGLYEVDGKKIDKNALMSIYDELAKEFDFISIEDPFFEEDFESFALFQEKNPNIICVGDDLTVTNKELLEKAIGKKSIQGMIIKLNQIGTLSETLETMQMAKENGIELIVSHRSGETMDDFIADLAFAFCVFGLKSGSPLMKERMVKYERLKEISKL